MDLNYFDLAIGIIILLLGLKGILNGFFKELFGLIGIIGGIFVASRVGDETGQVISDLIFHFESASAIAFTGFLVTLAIFWALMIGAGLLFKKLSTLSGLGPFDRILGFVLGSGKFFLIASVIIFAIFNVKAIRKNLEPAMENSMLFGAMVATGGFIMKIDTDALMEDTNETTANALAQTEGTIENHLETIAGDAVAEQAETVIQEVRGNMEKDVQ